MVWNAGEQDRVYTKFKPEVMEKFPGDQEYIQSVSIASKFPKGWFPSYKHDKVTKDTKAVIYHGMPKPWSE